MTRFKMGSPRIRAWDKVGVQVDYMGGGPKKLPSGNEEVMNKREGSQYKCINKQVLLWETGAQTHCRPLGKSLEHALKLSPLRI